MNSFKLTAIGNLAKNPELVAKGEVSYTRFCLIGNDFAAKEEDGSAREIVTSVWFVAFGGLGETIANNARIGDQLILEARMRSNNWTDSDGEKQYDYSFVVENFRFGAPGKVRREELELRELQRDGDASRAALSNVG
jgi:single-strand DNA-binding protein